MDSLCISSVLLIIYCSIICVATGRRTHLLVLILWWSSIISSVLLIIYCAIVYVATGRRTHLLVVLLWLSAMTSRVLLLLFLLLIWLPCMFTYAWIPFNVCLWSIDSLWIIHVVKLIIITIHCTSLVMTSNRNFVINNGMIDCINVLLAESGMFRVNSRYL